jgi:nitrate/nitrite transporter NarK
MATTTMESHVWWGGGCWGASGGCGGARLNKQIGSFRVSTTFVVVLCFAFFLVVCVFVVFCLLLIVKTCRFAVATKQAATPAATATAQQQQR